MKIDYFICGLVVDRGHRQSCGEPVGEGACSSTWRNKGRPMFNSGRYSTDDDDDVGVVWIDHIISRYSNYYNEYDESGIIPLGFYQ